MIISDFPIPRVKVGCWVRLYSPLLICCFSEKGDRVRVTTVPNLACGCWTVDLLRCVYRAALAPLWWYVPSCGPTLKVDRHLYKFVSFKQICIIWCINVFTSLLGLVIVSHLSPRGLRTLHCMHGMWLRSLRGHATFSSLAPGYA